MPRPGSIQAQGLHPLTATDICGDPPPRKENAKEKLFRQFTPQKNKNKERKEMHSEMVSVMERTTDSIREKRRETCIRIERTAEDIIQDDEKKKIEDIVLTNLEKIPQKNKRESAKKMLSNLIKESKVNSLLFSKSPECRRNNGLFFEQDV